MKKILVDSSPLIALFDASDNHHNAAVSFIKKPVSLDHKPYINNRNTAHAGF